jgi:hypothetical protein
MVVAYIFALVLLLSIHMFAQEILRLGRLIATLMGKRDTILGSCVLRPSSNVSMVPPPAPVPGQKIAFCSADELCDELLMHMLDCDVCLTRGEYACSGYRFLHWQVVAQGGPHKGIVFAI